jgi:hypothetical protein
MACNRDIFTFTLLLLFSIFFLVITVASCSGRESHSSEYEVFVGFFGLLWGVSLTARTIVSPVNLAILLLNCSLGLKWFNSTVSALLFQTSL